MALTATIYNLRIALSDVDRSVYENFELRVARQPSETAEYMLTRVLAYCLEYAEGIAFTEGVAAADEPSVVIRDLTGKITAWIDVGLPSPERLHRGLKLAGRAAVYTHRDARKLVKDLAGAGIPRLAAVPVYGLDREMVEQIAGLLDRRTEVILSITERTMYMDIGGRLFTSAIVQHRIA